MASARKIRMVLSLYRGPHELQLSGSSVAVLAYSSVDGQPRPEQDARFFYIVFLRVVARPISFEVRPW